ncbi:polymorphic toxin-type HINT domain-containing protein [Paenibacillus motobuensis]|uniref:polymorphic toxin-type HINT domain-containing protein n=1 Tax=Paenibacillus TaxID=44249 RepID=UPI00204034B0|nr:MULTISPECIES: polymorphic toxin-type HINT domain-containing protein [Paenibacillus]MCM3040575.1 polymorphic toxin-type HINT domain-containing protein [Paenibacillus lutimineralis]MCM3647679.1 polymorphic toxin-type HINT domain-containing protein [Paenibacillus motobuensis]
MFKRVVSLILCLTLITTGLLETVAYGAGETTSNKMPQPNQGDIQKILTISEVMQQFGVSTDWMDEQLSKGYTLYQIYMGLQSGKEDYEKVVSQFSVDREIDRKSMELHETAKEKIALFQTTDLSSNYDQAAVEHLSLQDEFSLHEINFGEDTLSTATGDMRLYYTDLSLPGTIPFSLTRIYDTSRASEEIGIGLENGTYVNQTRIRREERDSGIGRGWRWALPFIEVQEGGQILDFPGIGRYKISDTLKLEGYPWSNLLLMKDASKTVGGLTSETKVSVLNGNDYFFSSSGHLLLTTDNYGNRVEFYYTSHGDGKVLNRIANSDGNELSFSYSGDRVTVTQPGTNRRMDYFIKSAVDGQPVLSEVQDALSRSTKYLYYYTESRFNFLESLMDQEERQPVKHSALLLRIVHPSSGITEFDYTSVRKQIGPIATDFAYKTSMRRDVYSTTSGDNELLRKSFSYAGEDLNQFGKTVSSTTTVKSSRSEEEFKFIKKFYANTQPDVYFLNEQRSKESTTEFRMQFAYDNSTGWNVPTQAIESYLQGGAESQQLTVNYQYNEQGQILKESWSTGQENVYEYTTSTDSYFWSLPSQIQSKISGEQKRVERIQYNPQGDVSQFAVRENSGSGKLLAQTDLEYDDFGNVIISKTKDDKRNNIVNYSYQSPYGKHLLTEKSLTVHSITGGSSLSEEKFDYTKAGELLTSEDEVGDITSYTYDALGRMTKTQYSDQSTTTIQYDDVLNRVTVTGPEGIVTVEKYDPLGLLVEESVSDALFKYKYDGEGNLEQEIDAEQNKTSYVYDGFGRLTKTIYADGSQDETSYDMVRRTVTNTDPVGVKYQQKLDLLGNLLAVEEWRNGAFVALEQATYDLSGNALAVTDGKGQQTLYQYDALGRVISVTDPEQRSTSYKYTMAGDLSVIQYPDNSYIEREYDEAGNLIRQVNEERMTEIFYYDAKGNLTKSLDHASQFTEYQYNKDNLLTKIQAPDQQIQYTYDAMGRRIGMTDTTGSTTYDYNPSDGSLATIHYPDGTRINYTYNKQMRTGYTLTDVFGKTTGASYTVNEMNRVSALEVLHHAAGSNQSTLAAKSSASGAIDRITFDYKANGLLEKGESGNGPSMSFSYEGYDLTGVTINPGAAAKRTVAPEVNDVSETETSKGYDSMTTGDILEIANEVTFGVSELSAAKGHEFTYEYDLNKNIIGRTQNGAGNTFTYDPLNRIHTESGLNNNKKYSYDGRGNLLDVEGRPLRGLSNADYTFDSLNRLTKVKGEDGTGISYIYNGYGLLYERIEGKKKSRYYYDEEAKLIAEADISSGKPKLIYTYIYDFSGQLWSRVDQITGEIQYYQFNGHGDIVGLTDSQGNQLNTYSYDIWGNPETVEETVPNIFRYSGEYWDNVTDLQYLRARWYDPNSGRFVSKDSYEGSIDNPLSMNRYSYVHNNPLIYTDPSGQYIMPMAPTPSLTCAVDIKNCKTNLDAQIKGTRQALDIVYLDDVRTIMDDKASKLEKGIVIVQYIPVVKAYKVVKKTEKVIDSSKDIVKSTKKLNCNCFTAGTKVLTDEGEKNIEDIEVGDKVLSKNEDTDEVAYKEVTATFNHETDEIYNIHVGGQMIESTFNHPFYVKDRGWTFVKDLKVGDLLVQSDGNTLKVDSIELEHKQATVYNLRVDDFHTYFVSELDIWVHNTNCWGKFSSDDLKKLTQADQKDIKRITGNADDAFGFFKEQVSSYKEVSTGVFVGKDANGVTFTYRAASKSGPPTIDVNGISGVRKIKFLED